MLTDWVFYISLILDFPPSLPLSLCVCLIDSFYFDFLNSLCFSSTIKKLLTLVVFIIYHYFILCSHTIFLIASGSLIICHEAVSNPYSTVYHLSPVYKINPAPANSLVPPFPPDQPVKVIKPSFDRPFRDRPAQRTPHMHPRLLLQLYIYNGQSLDITKTTEYLRKSSTERCTVTLLLGLFPCIKLSNALERCRR